MYLEKLAKEYTLQDIFAIHHRTDYEKVYSEVLESEETYDEAGIVPWSNYEGHSYNQLADVLVDQTLSVCSLLANYRDNVKAGLIALTVAGCLPSDANEIDLDLLADIGDAISKPRQHEGREYLFDASIASWCCDGHEPIPMDSTTGLPEVSVS